MCKWIPLSNPIYPKLLLDRGAGCRQDEGQQLEAHAAASDQDDVPNRPQKEGDECLHHVPQAMILLLFFME